MAAAAGSTCPVVVVDSLVADSLADHRSRLVLGSRAVAAVVGRSSLVAGVVGRDRRLGARVGGKRGDPGVWLVLVVVVVVV